MDRAELKAIKATRGGTAAAGRSTSGIDASALKAATARNKVRAADGRTIAARDARSLAGPKGKAHPAR